MDLECLNDKDLNEPNIAMRRVDGRSSDSAPRESVLPCSDFGVEFNVPRSPICSLCIPAFVLAILLPRGGSLARRPRSGTLGPGGPRDFDQDSLSARFEGSFACQWSEPRELCQKRRLWGIGVSWLKQDAPEMRPDVSLVTLALKGIFEAPYWAPFGASVAR
ncbi:hypothetical protein CRG98_012162 [Punica granatum]|uniref:Uncharacterized protein n=1 Tax=Punica granatum TaxID=22663 RepID=A0A2I0KGW8_PUNGR|nr:hypothetical protein CRG98_012162 [Punica granatum]